MKLMRCAKTMLLRKLNRASNKGAALSNLRRYHRFDVSSRIQTKVDLGRKMTPTLPLYTQGNPGQIPS